MKLPKKVYVSWRDEDEDDRFLVCYTDPEDAVDDDSLDPTLVGTYELVETKKLKITVTEA